MITTTTEYHFGIFKEECKKWIDYFGLKYWSVWYTQEELKDAYAQCATKYIGKVATLTLNTKLDLFIEDDIIYVIKKSAFHEVCELMLSKLATISETYFSEDMVSEEIHIVIRILENSIFEESLKKE